MPNVCAACGLYLGDIAAGQACPRCGGGISVREACRRRRPLDGADAQALEHVLAITERERDEALKRLREIEGGEREVPVEGTSGAVDAARVAGR